MGHGIKEIKNLINKFWWKSKSIKKCFPIFSNIIESTLHIDFFSQEKFEKYAKLNQKTQNYPHFSMFQEINLIKTTCNDKTQPVLNNSVFKSEIKLLIFTFTTSINISGFSFFLNVFLKLKTSKFLTPFLC